MTTLSQTTATSGPAGSAVADRVRAVQQAEHVAGVARRGRRAWRPRWGNAYWPEPRGVVVVASCQRPTRLLRQRPTLISGYGHNLWLRA